jgi:hypothetical protein
VSFGYCPIRNENSQPCETEIFSLKKKAPFLELFISSFKEIFLRKSEYAISFYIKKPTKQ